MPFKKVNVKEEINKRLEMDAELKKAYDHSQQEYEVVKQIVKMRNEMGLSQSDVARQSGLTQQMVSRIETVDNSPTLRNFIKYVDNKIISSGGMNLKTWDIETGRCEKNEHYDNHIIGSCILPNNGIVLKFRDKLLIENRIFVNKAECNKLLILSDGRLIISFGNKIRIIK